MTQAILDHHFISATAGVLTVFNFDGTTGEYLDANEEFLAQGVGLPANACLDAPPKITTGYIAQRTGDVWAVVADHRGKTLYNTDTGEPIVISALGELPANSTALAPTTPFDRWNGTQWVTDKTARHSADIAAATAQRTALLAVANATITPLADAVDLNMASDAETLLLNDWRRYRVLLNRVAVNTAPDIVWPEAPAANA